MNDKDHLSSWVTDLIGRCIEDIDKTKSFALNIFSFFKKLAISTTIISSTLTNECFCKGLLNVL